VDPLDFAVYRYLSPGGEARFWAGRRVIDPRITPREISERTGITESSARTRLLHLARDGILRDRMVIPNPALFGVRVFVADLPIRDSGEVDRILRDLTLVEGVVFTRDVLDEAERKIQVHFLADSVSTAARLGALLGRLAPDGRPVETRAYFTPPCERDPTRLEWRVLQCVWRRPSAGYSEIKDEVGVSLKTAARCYHRLIDSRACWWTHGPESEEYPLALVQVELRSPKDLPQVLGRLVTESESWMPVAADGLGLEAGDSPTTLAGLVPSDRPVALERLLRRLSSLEGIARLKRTFALGSESYPAWYSARILSKVHSVA
jgi:DNA-binding Lrp family transcriptional regulator